LAIIAFQHRLGYWVVGFLAIIAFYSIGQDIGFLVLAIIAFNSISQDIGFLVFRAAIDFIL